jgi:membrane protein YdbS with pleckstrin-like domain
MVRLRPGARAVFGEKLLDLANLAAAALVFGQFVGRQPLSWTVIVTGVTIWFVIALIALWMMGAWRWRTLSES